MEKKDFQLSKKGKTSQFLNWKVFSKNYGPISERYGDKEFTLKPLNANISLPSVIERKKRLKDLHTIEENKLN